MKQFIFVSGMPRSGSTLLCNILAQNPNIHATATSGVLELLFQCRNSFDSLIEFRAMDGAERDAAKLRTLRGILEGYFSNVEKPIIAEKSRGWLAYLEMAETVLGVKPKVLVPVRDLRDILASMEKMWRETQKTQSPAGELGDNYFQMQTVEGRLRYWCDEKQVVGLAFNRVKDAQRRGWGEQMHFVHYEKLTANPYATLDAIYKFLELPQFNHDFENVAQMTSENDDVHGFRNLHKIRARVAPQAAQWERVLGDAATPYAGQAVW